MPYATRRKLDKSDLDTLLGRGWISIPSTVRRRVMSTLMENYRRLLETPGYEDVFTMPDEEQFMGDDGTKDVGVMKRDPSKKDKKALLHFTMEMVGEVNARGFDWATCPELVSSVTQIQAEAKIVASDVAQLLEKHCFPDQKFYGMSLTELYAAGHSQMVSRLLDYRPGSHLMPKGTAAIHRDRNFGTLHFGSSEEGFYIINHENGGKPQYLDDRDPDRILFFLGTKLGWMTQDPAYNGLLHGVRESSGEKRLTTSRFAAITFTHLRMPKPTAKEMCDFLDLERPQLALKHPETCVSPAEAVPNAATANAA